MGQRSSTLTCPVGGLEVEDQANMGTYVPVEASSKMEMLVNIGDRYGGEVLHRLFCLGFLTLSSPVSLG